MIMKKYRVNKITRFSAGKGYRLEIDTEISFNEFWSPSIEENESEINDGTYLGTLKNIKKVFKRDMNCEVVISRDIFNAFLYPSNALNNHPVFIRALAW